MAWYLDTTRIFVQDEDSEYKQIIPRLQPVAGGTVHQIFGYETEIKRLNALVVGSGDLFDLTVMTTDGSYHTLTTPEEVISGYLVSAVKSKRQKATLQTIRPDLDCETPIWLVDIELFKDET